MGHGLICIRRPHSLNQSNVPLVHFWVLSHTRVDSWIMLWHMFNMHLEATHKSLFPVQQPGGYFLANWEPFVCIFAFFPTHITLISYTPPPPQKKGGGGGERKFAASRLATLLATRWTGKKLFLRVA